MFILRNRRVFGPALAGALAFAVCAGLAAGADTGAPEFAYSGDNGPGFWGATPGWEACAGTSRTQRQSPIDVNHVVFDRRLGPLQLRLDDTPLALTNNGHTIEEEYEPGSSLMVNGIAYGLSQFHFHTLSEHTVAGRHAAHGTARGVRGPRLRQQGGRRPAVRHRQGQSLRCRAAEAWLAGEERGRSERPLADDQRGGALTNTSRYYTYPGSLTTPPCSETVTWFVLHEYAQLSSEQFDAFRHILGNNFRPVQKRNERTIRSTVGEDDER